RRRASSSSRMIHLDTSALIASLTGPRPAAPVLRGLYADGERLAVSTLVLYEWWRGPRPRQELEEQEALFPAAAAFAFAVQEARIAADLYRQMRRPRGREID